MVYSFGAYLYSSWVSPGMSEKEARTALLAHPDPL